MNPDDNATFLLIKALLKGPQVNILKGLSLDLLSTMLVPWKESDGLHTIRQYALEQYKSGHEPEQKEHGIEFFREKIIKFGGYDTTMIVVHDRTNQSYLVIDGTKRAMGILRAVKEKGLILESIFIRALVLSFESLDFEAFLTD